MENQIKSFITYEPATATDGFLLYRCEFVQELIEVYFDFDYQMIHRIPPVTYQLPLN